MIHCMYTPLLPVDLESIVLLLASILLALIVTAELYFMLWHTTEALASDHVQMFANNNHI